MKVTVILALAGLLAAQPPRPGPGRLGQGGPRGERQQSQQQQQEPVKPEDLCVIEGQAVNGSTGEPVRKATVVLTRVGGGQGSAPAGATTDAGGLFILKDIAPGRYWLFVERNGFVRADYGARSNGRERTALTLEKGQRLKDIVFRLVPHGVIAGRIVDEDGEPVARATVQASRFAYNQGRKRLMPGGAGQTNDLGEFRIFGIAPGKYFVSAAHPARGMMRAVIDQTSTNENYATTYYPGSREVATAVQLDVAPGSTLSGIDIKLLRTHTVRVSGRVIDTIASDSRRRAMVQLIPRGLTGVADTLGRAAQPIRDARGAFEFRAVVPGSYILSAERFEDGKRFTARMPLEVGNSPIDNLQLTITPGVELAGQVRAEGGAEIEFAAMNVSLRVRDGGGLVSPAESGRVKADGTFTLQNVSPDHYSVNIAGMPAGYYLKSVRFGEEDALENGANLSGGAGGKLDVLISAKGAELEGVVINSKQQPAPGASVALVPAEPSKMSQLHLFKLAATDQYGRYSIAGVAPGEYKLFAFEDLETGAHLDPDFLRPFDREAEPVSVKEGARESKQLKLIGLDASGSR